MKKSEALENHICRFNDGEQSCKCFMAGQEAGKREATDKINNAAEMLWVVLANVSEGDWTKQTKEWQKAAARWRDNYFKYRIVI